MIWNNANEVDKTYHELLKFCEAQGFENSLKALPYAKKLHDKVSKPRRGNGLPYFSHPLFVAINLMARGVVCDDSIATSILHDTKEEDPTCTLRDLDVSDTIKKRIDLLTFQKGELEKRLALLLYMKRIVTEGDAITNLVKDDDRFHNLSTMTGGAFYKEKMLDYTDETKALFYPNFDVQRSNFPAYACQFDVLEYDIHALVNLAENIWTIPTKAEQEAAKKQKELKRQLIFPTPSSLDEKLVQYF